MYCSHKQFINIATATGVETSALGHMLSDILSLVQCRGSMVKSSRFQEVVANVAPETAKMMQLLHKVDKLDATSLKALVSIVGHGKTGSFKVTGTAHVDAIQKKLAKDFGSADITSVDTDDLQLQVAGNGRRYKRSLTKDVEKILR